jgi:uncharacterized protein
MKNHMAYLAEIIKIDQGLQSIKEELDEVPVKVRAVETELKGVESEYKKKKEEADKIAAQLHQMKDTLTEDSSRLKSKEERLHLIKTTKEYQAVMKEISMGKTASREDETQITKLTSALEILTKDLAPLEEKRGQLHATLEKEKAEIQGTLDGLTAKLKEAEAQLNEQLLSLPEDIRHKYRRIQQKRIPAIAKVVGGTCQECFMNVPPQLFIEIQKHQEIYSCPNCHRLLYVEI